MDNPSAAKYASHGPLYHWAWYAKSGGYARGLRYLLGCLPRRGDGATLLDFGAGSGVLAYLFSLRGYRVTAYEPLAEVVGAARLVVPELLITAKLPAGPFDYVIANDVLEHMHDPEPLLDSLRRVRCYGLVAVPKPGRDAYAVRDWTLPEFKQALGKGCRVKDISHKRTIWKVVPR